MSETKQKTLLKPVSFSGIGLHTGQRISVTLHPAPTDSGIVFNVQRKGAECVQIPARYLNIGALSYNTGLKASGVEIRTVEHLLSALHGFSLDNVIIELDNHEVPVMDGSASAFVYLLSEAGIRVQDAPKRTVRLTREVRVERGDAWMEAGPSSSGGLSIDYSINFDHPAIGSMRYRFSGGPRAFSRAIAPARTFGFLKEVEYLRKQGLIRGASMRNALVLNDHRVISGELRFPDEFVRHKVLDFWGDIVLLGRPLIAKVKAHKAGHQLHAMLVEKLVKTPGLLEPVTEKVPHRILNWKPRFQSS